MHALWRSVVDFPVRYRRVTASGSYVPQIDGLRFFAIIIVVIYHATSRMLKYYTPVGDVETTFVAFQPLGQAGVELFFFISGLIISYPFLSGHAPRLTQFYKRRLLRLEPPYILVLTICFIALGVVGLQPAAAPTFHDQEMPLYQSYLSSIFYLHGTLYGTAPRLNPPLWSLEIEVVFYLLAPFIIAAYLKLRSFRTRMIVAAVATVVAILIQAYVVTNFYPWYYRFPTHMFAFFLGIAVSDWTSRRENFYRPRGRIFDAAWLAGLVLLLVSASLDHLATTGGVATALLLLRAVSILGLFIGSAWGPIARRITGAPWIALIGGACYSIYLVHIPVMNVGASLVFRFVSPGNLAQAWTIAVASMILISVVAGLIFYVLIERPCMRKDWPSALWRRVTGGGKPAITAP